jgi:ketosteroid isomerase-like protein
MSQVHAELLGRALEAAATGDTSSLAEIFTEDVTGWSPNMLVVSRDELAAELAERDDALTNVSIEIDTMDAHDGRAAAEWRVAANHTGPLVLDEDIVIEPTDRRIVLAGATFAEFRDGKICAFRHYFDDAALLEQLLIA